jgi:molybdenum cofactor cytidylyltransferase
MPFIQAETLVQLWQALITGAALVAPCYQSQRGHPVGFSSTFKTALVALNQDQGAQRLLQQQQAPLQLIQTQDAGVVLDIDTPSDLQLSSKQSLPVIQR